MAQGQEYLTSNAAIAYPFQEDASGLIYGAAVHGSSAKLPSDVIVDMLVVVPASIGQVYLRSIQAVGDNCNFTFVDADGTVIISGAPDLTGWQPTAYYNYLLLEDTAANIRVQMVIKTSAYQTYVVGLGVDTFGLTLPLEHRVINHLCNRVLSLELYTSLPEVPEPNVPGPITGNVKLISGYNIVQDLGADANGVITNTLSADPGAGAGPAPCQHEGDSDIREQLMGVVPDANGNIQLMSGKEECYAVIPHKDLEMFELDGNCVACCQCDDYASVGRAITKVFEMLKDVYGLLDAGRTAYELGATTFNSYVNNSNYAKPTLVVNGMTGKRWGDDPLIRSGAQQYISLVLTLKNQSNETVSPRSLTVSFTQPPPASITVTYMNWTLLGKGGKLNGGPVLSIFPYDLTALPDVPRGKSLVIYLLARTPDYALLDGVWRGVAEMEVGRVGKPNLIVYSNEFIIE